MSKKKATEKTDLTGRNETKKKKETGTLKKTVGKSGFMETGRKGPEPKTAQDFLQLYKT